MSNENPAPEVVALTEGEIADIGRVTKKVAGIWPPTPALEAFERILADRLAAVLAR